MEPRRIEVQPVVPPENVGEKKKSAPTLRFRMQLGEPTEKSCPEFSYIELVKNALGQDSDEDLDPNDPFAKKDKEEHDKLLAMAQKFEAKYGENAAPMKKKRRYVDDVIDIGDGYDLNDPFVDDSEKFDEIVPSNLTTRLGGFYINSGKLDFRYVSDNSVMDSHDDFQNPIKKKKKKRIITSDSEGENTGGASRSNSQLSQSQSQSQSAIKKRGRPKGSLNKVKKDGGLMEMLKKRKKKKLSASSVGSESEQPLKKKKKLDKIKGMKLKKSHLLPSGQLSQPQSSGGGDGAGSIMTNGGTVAPPTVVLSDDDSDSLDNEITNGVADGASKMEVGGVTTADSTSMAARVAGGDSPRTESPRPQVAPALPPAVEGRLAEAITAIKAAAAKDSGQGKQKFFNGTVNDLLLQIENESQAMDVGVRSTIFSHLAFYLPCGKNTLIKRAKKLRLNMGDDKLKEPIARLKEAVSQAMPEQLEKWHAEMQLFEQIKHEKKLENKDKEDGHTSATGSDDEGEKTSAGGEGASAAGDAAGGKKEKRLMAPRKKFEWTDTIRKLLLEVVRIKMATYESLPVKTHSAEDYLRAFLDAEIRPLWPQGWMQTRMLFKESRLVHGSWTNSAQKPRKPLQLVKTTPGAAVSGASQPTTPVAATPTMPGSGGHATGTSNLYASPHLPAAKPSTKSGPPDSASELSSVQNLLDFAGQSFLNAAKAKISPQKLQAGQDSAAYSQQQPTSGLSFGTNAGISTPLTSSMKNLAASSLDNATKPSPAHLHTSPTGSAAAASQPPHNKNFMDIFQSFAKTNELMKDSSKDSNMAATANMAASSGYTSSSHHAVQHKSISSSSSGHGNKAVLSLTTASSQYSQAAPSSSPAASRPNVPAYPVVPTSQAALMAAKISHAHQQMQQKQQKQQQEQQQRTASIKPHTPKSSVPQQSGIPMQRTTPSPHQQQQQQYLQMKQQQQQQQKQQQQQQQKPPSSWSSGGARSSAQEVPAVSSASSSAAASSSGGHFDIVSPVNTEQAREHLMQEIISRIKSSNQCAKTDNLIGQLMGLKYEQLKKVKEKLRADQEAAARRREEQLRQQRAAEEKRAAEELARNQALLEQQRKLQREQREREHREREQREREQREREHREREQRERQEQQQLQKQQSIAAQQQQLQRLQQMQQQQRQQQHHVDKLKQQHEQQKLLDSYKSSLSQQSAAARQQAASPSTAAYSISQLHQIQQHKPSPPSAWKSPVSTTYSGPSPGTFLGQPVSSPSRVVAPGLGAGSPPAGYTGLSPPPLTHPPPINRSPHATASLFNHNSPQAHVQHSPQSSTPINNGKKITK